MNHSSQKHPPLRQLPLRRIITLLRRSMQIGRDERGSVMLLSGVMVFLTTVLALFALVTSEAIQRRITAQNAADAAAEAAALWHTRGCNFIQHFNNLHYLVNRLAIDAEYAQFISCALAPITHLVGDFFAPPSGTFAAMSLCEVCD